MTALMTALRCVIYFASVALACYPKSPLGRPPSAAVPWTDESPRGVAPPFLNALPSLLTELNSSRVALIPFQKDAGSIASPSRADCPDDESGLLRWEVASTWSSLGLSSPPSLNTDVTIPENASVLLSPCSSLGSVVQLKSLVIPASSRLVIADAPLELVVGHIIVQGALVIGSPTCPVLSNITLTLTGSRPSEGGADIADAAAKTLVVNGSGSVDVHGAVFAPSWTRLAAPAWKGESWIILQQLVNWPEGGIIVLTTTALKDSRDYSETEECTIADLVALPGGQTAVRLVKKLRFTHWASTEYQAEVGLLSRRVTFQGSLSDSVPTDTGRGANLCATVAPLSIDYPLLPCGNTFLTGYGGAVWVNGRNASFRGSGILFLRMGQTNSAARTPLRFEGSEREGASWVRDSSIWKSYYRCVSVASSYFIKIERIVSHDVIGHCMHLSSGENNTLAFNLVSLVHPVLGDPRFPAAGFGGLVDSIESAKLVDYASTRTLRDPSDIAASSFFIPNRFNFVFGNAASGGWAGFMLPRFRRDVDSGRNSSARPRLTAWFDGNTAHSSGYYWPQAGCFHFGGYLADVPVLMFNPGEHLNSTAPANSTAFANATLGSIAVSNSKVFLCNGIGLQNWHNQMEVYRLELHDIGHVSAKLPSSIDKVLVTCRTQNSVTLGAAAAGVMETAFAVEGRPSGLLYPMASHSSSSAFGNTHRLSNVIIRNCTKNAKYFIVGDSDEDIAGLSSRVTYEIRKGYGPTLSRISPARKNSSFSFKWTDDDGSLSGRKVPTYIAPAQSTGLWWRNDARCTLFNSPSFWMCNRSAIGSVSIAGEPSIPPHSKGTVSHLGHHTDQSHAMAIPSTNRISGFVGGFGWVFGGSWISPPVLRFDDIHVGASQLLILVLPYPHGSTFDIRLEAPDCSSSTSGQCTWQFRSARNLNSVRFGPGDEYYFSNSTGHLYVRASSHLSTGIGEYLPPSRRYVFSIPDISAYAARRASLRIAVACPNCAAPESARLTHTDAASPCPLTTRLPIDSIYSCLQTLDVSSPPLTISAKAADSEAATQSIVIICLSVFTPLFIISAILVVWRQKNRLGKDRPFSSDEGEEVIDHLNEVYHKKQAVAVDIPCKKTSPSFWNRVVDGPAADDFFFKNTVTGEMTWHLPEGAVVVSGAVAPKWRLVPGSSFDDADAYYINVANGATCWDPPEEDRLDF